VNERQAADGRLGTAIQIAAAPYLLSRALIMAGVLIALVIVRRIAMPD
jgi:hypothetical protein